LTVPTKILLDEDELPTRWYNVIADLPSAPPPPLPPGTGQPVGPDDLAPLFPMALIGQEVTGERFVDIPGEVLDVYRLWRPLRPHGGDRPGARAHPRPGRRRRGGEPLHRVR
jgi:tryptophan synthase beta chain